MGALHADAEPINVRRPLDDLTGRYGPPPTYDKDHAALWDHRTLAALKSVLKPEPLASPRADRSWTGEVFGAQARSQSDHARDAAPAAGHMATMRSSGPSGRTVCRRVLRIAIAVTSRRCGSARRGRR